MSSVDRRNFLTLISMGGAASMLTAARAAAQEGRTVATGGLWDSLTVEAEDPVPRPVETPVERVLALGRDMSNIAEVRGIITSTIPAGDLASMANDLLNARQAYANGASGVPPAADSFETTFNSWAPILADALENSSSALSAASLEAVVQAVEEDQDPVDGWTLVHFTSGAILGALGFDFDTTLVLLILWEIVEPHIWPGWNESIENQIVDVIAGMLGWFVMQ